MNSRAVLCLACVLAGLSPAAASINDDGQTVMSGPMLVAPLRMAQDQTGATSAQTTTDAEPAAPRPAAAKPRRPKKTSEHEPARKSGAAIVKEGGKTCSGLDEYRVCW